MAYNPPPLPGSTHTNPAGVMSPYTMKPRDKCYFPSRAPKKISQIKKNIWTKKLGMWSPINEQIPSCIFYVMSDYWIQNIFNQSKIKRWNSTLSVHTFHLFILNPTHSLATNHLAQIFAVLVLFNKSWFKEMSRRVERKIISKKYTKFIFAINWNYKNIYSWIEVF